MSNQLIEKIRGQISEQGLSRSGLARAAGLHANSLRSLDDADWNPTAETLRKLETYLRQREASPGLVPIEDIIEEARNGRMFILVDDEDRENEGDLIIPAQMATPASINFMAKYGRGLICLALTKSRVDQLGLHLMSRNNGTRHETAFTVSIEAREGVTTGISAADRARTVSVAIDASKGSEEIVSPGHVFPLVARDGGVLVRTGHTEAAMDVSRLAGLNPSGVICEIMNEDGTMARMPDLIKFAREHQLKIGTIRDLIAYRLRHDHNVEKLAETELQSEFGGQWRAISFLNKAVGSETLALVKGKIDPEQATLVRMHSFGIFSDSLGVRNGRDGLLQESMRIIGEAGSGVVVVLNTPGGGFFTQEIAVHSRKDSMSLEEMNALRDYGVGAQVLHALGVHDMKLLTNSHHTLIALSGYGLNIVGEQCITYGGAN